VISQDIIKNLLSDGAKAPSGSNSQPWKFEVVGSEIGVYMLPEKDHAILNFRNRGTLLAHGALIENITIAAGHYDLKCEIKLFPDKTNPNFVASIKLTEGGDKKEEGLFNAISKRTTNRKSYEARGIDMRTKESLLAVPGEIGERNIILKLTEDRGEIATLASAASTNEAIMLENEKLHKLFFDEIVWTEEEEIKEKAGLYLKAMELKPPQAFALRLFKNWSVMSFFNKLGAAKGIAKSNAKGYMQCPAYGAILCDNKDDDFIGVGRVMERAWLKATAAGLSFHLQTGTNFLYQNLPANEKIFSAEHTALIRAQYQKIADIFGAGTKLVPITFRIGYDGEPSARSSKKAPEVIFK
jgi:nitroreductase